MKSVIFAAMSALAALSSAAPTQPRNALESRAVKGPVIFLSNCFNTNGAEYGEFEYYADASTSVLNKKSSAPTLTNVINTDYSVSYTEGGTFVTSGTAPAFHGIFSIDENDFAGPGSRVGNGKTTTYFWAQICYEMDSATIYSPSSSVKCTSRIYCVPGPKDTSDL